VVCLLDDFEEGETVLGLFSPASCETPWGGCERSKMGAVKTSVDRTRKRGVRSDNEIVVFDL
jgi:hypothetical protein